MNSLCLVAQSCLTLCNPMDCSQSVHGILQARILEWVAMPSSRGSSQPRIDPRSLALQADSLPSEPSRKPRNTAMVSLTLLQGNFLTQESNGVFCIAGRFFTSWDTREAQWIGYYLHYFICILPRIFKTES